MGRICLLMTVLSASLCLAQNAEALKEPLKFYKLDFVMKDLDGGKVIVARSYSLLVATGHNSEVRSGNKIPVPTGGTVDIGTNFDCAHITEVNDGLSFDLSAEVTSLLQENDTHPVIRQNRWRSNVIVPLKKPTVVFSSDDNTTKRVMQLEVTATPRM